MDGVMSVYVIVIVHGLRIVVIGLYVEMSHDSTYAVIGCNNFASWIFSNMFDLAKKFCKTF